VPIVILKRVDESTATKNFLYDNKTLQYDHDDLGYHGHLMTTEDLDAMMQILSTCVNQAHRFDILEQMLYAALQYALPAVVERVMPLLLNKYRQQLNVLQSFAEQQNMQQQQQVRDVEKETQEIKDEVRGVFRISRFKWMDYYSRIRNPGINPAASKTKADIAVAIRQDQQKIMDCWVKLVSEEFFEFKGILLGKLQKVIAVFSAPDYRATQEYAPYHQMVLGAQEQLWCSMSLFNQSMRVVHKHGLFSKLALSQDHPIRQAYEEQYGVLQKLLVDESGSQQQQQI